MRWVQTKNRSQNGFTKKNIRGFGTGGRYVKAGLKRKFSTWAFWLYRNVYFCRLIASNGERKNLSFFLEEKIFPSDKIARKKKLEKKKHQRVMIYKDKDVAKTENVKAGYDTVGILIPTMNWVQMLNVVFFFLNGGLVIRVAFTQGSRE